jgi:hypothetical protein
LKTGQILNNVQVERNTDNTENGEMVEVYAAYLFSIWSLNTDTSRPDVG